MTHRYKSMAPLDALYSAVRNYPGSVEGVAARMDISPNVLRNKLMPSQSKHHTSVEEFSAILGYLQDAQVRDCDAPLEALCWRHGFVPVKLPDVESEASDHLLEIILDKMDRDGKLARILAEAVQDDGKIDDEELDLLEKHIQQAIGLMLTLRERVRARHQADSRKAMAVGA